MSGEVLFLGGLFNYTDPFFGFQIYLWGFAAILVMTVIAWLAWRYGQWEPYKPVWGIFYAFKAESQAAFIFNTGLVSELLSERDAKCIFDYSSWNYKGISRFKSLIFNYATVFIPELPLAKAILYKYGGRNLDVEIAKKMQNNEWEKFSSVTISGIHSDMIHDADNWTVRDSPQHKAIESFCDVHNDANPNDQIHAYPKFMRLCLERKIVPPEGVNILMTVPWSRIDSAFPPMDKDTGEEDGAVRQFARELEEQDNNSLSKYYMPIIVAGTGIIVLIMLSRLLTHFLG